MLFFTLSCAPPLRPAVPAAGHARRSNKGCTKRQSLPNCQHNGRIPPHDRPGSSGPGVILAERPGRNGMCQAGGRQKNRRADKGTRQLYGQPAGASGRDGEKQPGKGRVTEKQGRQEKQEPPERNKGKYRQKQGVPAKARTARGRAGGEVAGGGQAAGCFTGGNRGDATQTGMQEKTEKKTEKKTETWMPRGAATTVNTAERHCGSRTMRTKKTVRTARMIRMIRMIRSSADGMNWYELVRTGANWCESATRWTGRRCGESGKSRESGESGESGERIERKKQACENAGPTTRPESRSES